MLDWMVIMLGDIGGGLGGNVMEGMRLYSGYASDVRREIGAREV